MCRKKNENDKLIIPDNLRTFYKNHIQYVLDYEIQRENSILEQSSRLLVVESIIAAGYFQFITTCVSSYNLEIMQQKSWITLLIVAGVTLFLSIITTLLSQHRFLRKGLPNLYKIKKHISQNCKNFLSEKLEFDYTEEYIEKMYTSLKKLNDFRSLMLTITIVIVVISITIMILFLSKFVKGV